MTTIYVTSGAQQYVSVLVEETTGKDITEATVRLGLSSSPFVPPEEWFTPDVDESPSADSRLVKLLVTDSTEPGDYAVWVNVEDAPEVAQFQVGAAISVR